MAKKNYTGKLITIEGIEGVGKSTMAKYLQTLLVEQQLDFLATREPGGTEIAESIREILLQNQQTDEVMAQDTELLLMFASRAQHLAAKIIPALKQGKWVVCDRFTDASYAYQGGGRGIAKVRISALERWVQAGLRPDLTFLLIAPVKVALSRITKRGQLDRIETEKKSFFSRVQKAYLERAKANPTRYKIIQTNKPLKKVQQAIASNLNEFIDKHDNK